MICFSCTQETDDPTLFKLMDNESLGIDFINTLDYTEELNTYTFRNFYNGGGVAIGDINNDGLVDVFFSGNLVDNKLYLNKGDWKFEDISEQAGIASTNAWSMGAAMVDINGDGLLDIYVCKSGPPGGPNRNNALYINNGDLSFSEKSKEYGVADEGLSTHAAFFDYDKDGDLDFYLLNNSIKSVGAYDFRPGQRNKPDTLGGNKFYRNDGNSFTDVSSEAGIYTSAIGFGLGVTVGDVNGDGWQDMYISNDYFEKDYLYINQKDGSFKESLEEYINEISLSSMGADMGDLNNDGYPEIFVTDMMPASDRRIKTKTTFDNWDKYEVQVKNGYFKQFTRNALQQNNQDGTFSEISRMAGTSATDWSWGALIFDMDNDGLKDIFVANGIFKDLTDQDYVNYIGDPRTVREILKRENKVIKRLIDSIPSEPLANSVFKNRGQLSFEDNAQKWGLDHASFSNGSAYGDLDNDGDLDLVVSNVNMPPFFYQNNAQAIANKNHWISIKLIGYDKNTNALGTKLIAHCNNEAYFQEHMTMRSYQSTTDHRIHFGIGSHDKVDSLVVIWPDLTQSKVHNIKADTFLTLDYKIEQRIPYQPADNSKDPLFNSSSLELDYVHHENSFIDFDRDRLIPHMLSNEGPCSCTGDINGDGNTDIYLGGAKDQPGQLYTLNKDNEFILSNTSILEQDGVSEDLDCTFFDADNDGDLDLYVASGGNEFPASSSALLDRLYVNDGQGGFTKSPQLLPIPKYISSSTVKATDFDNDGDQDLFVGGRLNPFAYGTPTSSYLLQNDGAGQFKDISAAICPELKDIGMVKDGLWVDLDNDQDQDLVLVGEWMPITMFYNEGGSFNKVEVPNSQGWWNVIESIDSNKDGLTDFVVGNHGLNSRFKASADKPITMHINDFDRNGTIEQIISCYNGDESYPMTLRQDLVMQIPELKNKYLKFKNYSEKSIDDIFSKSMIESSIVHEAVELQTSLLINNGNENYELQALPVEAQKSPIYAFEIADFNKDGNDDIILGGNFSKSKPEIGIYEASYGLYLRGSGNGSFHELSSKESGIRINGEIRNFEYLELNDGSYLMVVKNNDRPEILKRR